MSSVKDLDAAYLYTHTHTHYKVVKNTYVLHFAALTYLYIYIHGNLISNAMYFFQKKKKARH